MARPRPSPSPRSSGTDLVVGTYGSAIGDPAPGQPGLRFDDCFFGSFTVLEIAPVPEAGIASMVTTLAVSFDLRCSAGHTLGQARVASAVPLTAYGFVLDGVPTTDMVVAADVPVGRSSTQRFTLVASGSEPLTLGEAAIIQTTETLYGDGWSIVADDCSGATLVAGPSDRCSIDVRLSSWLPAPRIVAVKIPADTDRGSIQVRLDGAVRATTFVPIEPTRIADTRVGLGISGSLQHRASRSLAVVDRRPGDPQRNVPADALAVAGNLTVTRQTSAGYVSLTTTPTNAPTTSTVNVPAGDTRANGVVIRLGGSATTSSGAIGATWVGAAGSSAHVVFDVTGYFVMTPAPAVPKSGNFESGDMPIRALDTRVGTGLAGSFAANTTRTLSVDLPDTHDGATAVTGNLTVVGATAAGYVSIGPTAADVKATSVINFPAGDVRANNTVVRLGPGNTIALRYTAPAGARVHVLFDVTGSFGAGSLGYVPLVQHRVFDTRPASPIAINTRPAITVAGRSQDPSRRVPMRNYGIPSPPARSSPTRRWSLRRGPAMSRSMARGRRRHRRSTHPPATSEPTASSPGSATGRSPSSSLPRPGGGPISCSTRTATSSNPDGPAWSTSLYTVSHASTLSRSWPRPGRGTADRPRWWRPRLILALAAMALAVAACGPSATTQPSPDATAPPVGRPHVRHRAGPRSG